jgi:hypothetical protein
MGKKGKPQYNPRTPEDARLSLGPIANYPNSGFHKRAETDLQARVARQLEAARRKQAFSIYHLTFLIYHRKPKTTVEAKTKD